MKLLSITKSPSPTKHTFTPESEEQSINLGDKSKIFADDEKVFTIFFSSTVYLCTSYSHIQTIRNIFTTSCDRFVRYSRDQRHSYSLNTRKIFMVKCTCSGESILKPPSKATLSLDHPCSCLQTRTTICFSMD
jgi:hypothetical protein